MYAASSGKHAFIFTSTLASVNRRAYESAVLPSVDDDEHRQRKKLKYSQGNERHESNVKEERVSEDETKQRRGADDWGPEQRELGQDQKNGLLDKYCADAVWKHALLSLQTGKNIRNFKKKKKGDTDRDTSSRCRSGPLLRSHRRGIPVNRCPHTA